MTIRKITLVLAVALLAGAQTTAIVPPREYDHPYSGHLIVQRMSEPDIRRTCYNPLKPGAANDVFPPEGYDYLFKGPIIITRKPNLTELNKVCGGNRLIGACGERRGYTCQIFILPDADLEKLRHQLPGNHPPRDRPLQRLAILDINIRTDLVFVLHEAEVPVRDRMMVELLNGLLDS